MVRRRQATVPGRILKVISLADCRKIEPSLSSMSDEEVLAIRDALYERATITTEIWLSDMGGSKNLTGVLPNNDSENSI